MLSLLWGRPEERLSPQRSKTEGKEEGIYGQCNTERRLRSFDEVSAKFLPKIEDRRIVFLACLSFSVNRIQMT